MKIVLLQKVETISANTAKNYILFAKWIENSYPINYNENGGYWREGFTPQTERPYTRTVTMPIQGEILKDGYTLKGWYDGDEKIVVTTNNNTRVYNVIAEWNIATYSVIIHQNGGYWAADYSYPTSQNRTINTPLITLPNNTEILKRGHTFE